MPPTRRSARSQARKHLSSPAPPVPASRKPRGSTPVDQSDEEPEADSKSGVTSNDDEDTPADTAEKSAKPLQPRRRRSRASPGLAPSDQGTPPATRRTRRRTFDEPADAAPSDVGEPDTVDEDVPLLPLHAESEPDKGTGDEDIADDTSDVAPEDITHSNAEVVVETDASDKPVLKDNPDEDSGAKVLSDARVVDTEPETHQASTDDPSHNESTRSNQTGHHREATRSVTLSNVNEARIEHEEPSDLKSAIDEELLDERKPLKADVHMADKGAVFDLSDRSQVVAPSPNSPNEDEVAPPPEDPHIESKAIVGKAVEGSETRVNIESILTNDEASCVNDTSVVSLSDRDIVLAADFVAPEGGHTEAETKPIYKSKATESAVAHTSAQHVLDDDKEVQLRGFPLTNVVNVEERDVAVISSGTIRGDPLDEVQSSMPPSLHFAGQSLAPSDVNVVLSKDASTVAVEIDRSSQHGMLEAERSDFAVVDSVEIVEGQEKTLERKEFNRLALGGMQHLQMVGECDVGGEALDNERHEGSEHHALEIDGEGILEVNTSFQKEEKDDGDLQNKFQKMDETIPNVSASRRRTGFADPESASATCSPSHESIAAFPGVITDESNAELIEAKNSDAGQLDGDYSMIQESVTSKNSVGTGNISIEKEFVMKKVHDNGTTNGISQEEQHVLTLENSASRSLVTPMLVCSEKSQRAEPSADTAASKTDVGDPIFKASHETLSQTGRKVARRVQGVSKPQASVQAIKVRIYTAGVVAHRGKGAEKLFASYWGALCRCFGTRFQGDCSDKRAWMLKGSRDVIKTFLTTKKLRRLHNSLILGLLNRCVDDTASAYDVASHIPSPWRNRVHVIHKDDARQCISIESLEFETAIKSDFQTQSRLWTSAGVSEELFTIPENVRPSLSVATSARTDDSSPHLPGALLVDPYVRSAAQREGLKVSENAVWLVVVGMREYIKSLLKTTIATIDSVNEIRELPRGSAIVTQSEAVAKARDIATADKDFVPTSTSNTSRKRKRVSALDVAACLMSTPVNRGHRANRLAFENCYLSAFDVHPVTSLGGFESIQRHVSSGITIASPKRPRSQKDSHFQPPEIKQQGGIAEGKAISDHPQPDVQSNRPSAGSVALPHPTQARRSPSIRGMGRGAKNLEALKARAAAAASAAKNDTQAVGASSASHQTATMNDNAEPAKPRVKPAENTPLPPEPKSTLSSNPRQSFPMHQKGSSPATEWPVAGTTDGSKVAVGFPGTTKAVAPSSSESAISLGVLQSDRTTGQVGSHGTLKSVERHPHEQSSPADRAGETGPLLDSGTLAPRADASFDQRPAVRGRGFGVKNLAMMRARSAGGIVDAKDEGNDAEVAKHSDELARPLPSSTAGAQGDRNESKAEGDHGNTTKADVSKLMETRKTASEPIAASESESKPNLDQKLDDKGHNEPVTNIGKYQNVGNGETLEASSEAVAKRSEQGQPLAYKV